MPNLQGRFLQGADGNLLQSIEAGLPNITGVLGINVHGEVSGAFSQRNGWAGSPAYTGNYNLNVFNAQNGETKTDGTLKTDSDYHVYGKSDTVQPPAFTVNYLIRY